MFVANYNWLQKELIGFSGLLQAAETGSGKTGVSLKRRSSPHFNSSALFLAGCIAIPAPHSPFCILQAFCLPIIQIVHETLVDVKEGKGAKGVGKSTTGTVWKYCSFCEYLCAVFR